MRRSLTRILTDSSRVPSQLSQLSPRGANCFPSSSQQGRRTLLPCWLLPVRCCAAGVPRPRPPPRPRQSRVPRYKHHPPATGGSGSLSLPLILPLPLPLRERGPCAVLLLLLLLPPDRLVLPQPAPPRLPTLPPPNELSWEGLPIRTEQWAP
jgi:hypothetical protein